MNKILFLLFITFSSVAIAQFDISTGAKATRVIEVLNENHLKPRVLNDGLAKIINDEIIASLDYDHLFLTVENIADLEENVPNLTKDLSNETQVYLARLKKLFEENLTAIKGYHEDYFSNTIDLELKPKGTAVDMDEFTTSLELEYRWQLIFRKSIKNLVLGELEDLDFDYTSDTLVTIIESASLQIKQGYGDYFKNITDDVSFLDNIYLNGIATAFDPHSSYFSFEQNKEFEEELSSEREIFGLSYHKNMKGEIEVTQIVPGSSAWILGQIHTGDIIRKIKFGDGKTVNLKGTTQYQLGEMFNANSSEDRVSLTIENENDGVRTIELLKTSVYSDEDIIKSALLNGERKIGYISLPDFYTNWTDESTLGCANDLAKTLIKLKSENIDGVILDLRDNGGGSLKEAIDLTGIFIDYGPILVAKDSSLKAHTYKDYNKGSIYRGPLIVLINEQSASASEVVAGALQDYNRAVIVGQPSFGKATGQSVYPIAPTALAYNPEKSAAWGFVKITEMGLYRIDLTTNQFNGVAPDIVLEVPLDYDPYREEDYSTALQLDSIFKKMYYTPLPKKDLASIAATSKERQESATEFIGIKLAASKLEKLYEGVDTYLLSLSESVTLRQKEVELRKEIIKIYDDLSPSFKSEALQYDAEVYQMSEYLDMYNKTFHSQNERDRELSEAYNIMLELINK